MPSTTPLPARQNSHRRPAPVRSNPLRQRPAEVTRGVESADLIAMNDAQLGIPTPVSPPPSEPQEAIDDLVREHLARSSNGGGVLPAAGNSRRSSRDFESTAEIDPIVPEPLADPQHNDDALRAEIAALLNKSPEAPSPRQSPPPAMASAPVETQAEESDVLLPPGKLDDLLQADAQNAVDEAAQAAGETPVLVETAADPSAAVANLDTDAVLADADAVLREELAALMKPMEQSSGESPADNTPAAANADAAAVQTEVAAEPEALAETFESPAQTAESSPVIATIEETIGVVEEVPSEEAPSEPAAAPETPAQPVYDTFPARDAAVEAAETKPAAPKVRRKSRFLAFCNDFLLLLAQILDMPFSRLPGEAKHYAGVTGVVSLVLGAATFIVVRFTHR